ncbi:MAG: Bcr/CflA family multidrug efflux MFS transporter [Candidatus Hydrogenedentes bacterium]|nr:Bcr/CflA family multidrug efflux MFS transporter [Candidatus Hydrogenedentota bacterium]
MEKRTPKNEPHPRRGFLVMLLGALVAFGPLSIDMYLPAMPSLARDFAVPLATVEFSVSAFLIGMAIGQLVYGPVSDRFGRKPLLYIGLTLYAASSAACALAPGAEVLIAARVMQALGSCAGVVVARAMVRDLFEPREAAGAFSLMMLVMGAAPILAPLLGGYITAYFGWRSIFWLLAVLALLCVAVLSRALPETHGADPGVRLRDSFRTYARILRHRQFMGYAVSGSLAQAGMMAYITGAPFIFIELFGVPAEHFGWIFGLNAFGLISMAQVNLLLLRRYTLDQVLRVSFALIAGIGFFLLLAGCFGWGIWPVGIGLFSYLAVLGITFPNTAAGALADQGAVAGSASALMGSIQFTLGFAASALLTRIHAHGSLPMTGIIAGCGLLALLAHRIAIGARGISDVDEAEGAVTVVEGV